MEDKTVADAILDRVLSDALRVSLTGDFMRQRGDQNLAASPEEKASPTKGVHETQGNRERLRNQSLKIPLGVVAKERIAKERKYSHFDAGTSHRLQPLEIANYKASSGSNRAL